MKIKSDFVTNSSSTSFIIADKTGKLNEILVRINENPEIIVDMFKVLKYSEIGSPKDYVYDDLNSKESSILFNTILNGGKCYVFSATDQEGILGSGFTNFGIMIEDIIEDQQNDIIVIRGDGGY